MVALNVAAERPLAEAIVAIIGYHLAACIRDDDNVCASLSAQTVLGGVLGGKLAIGLAPIFDTNS
jgi:hypothetical protein